MVPDSPLIGAAGVTPLVPSGFALGATAAHEDDPGASRGVGPRRSLDAWADEDEGDGRFGDADAPSQQLGATGADSAAAGAAASEAQDAGDGEGRPAPDVTLTPRLFALPSGMSSESVSPEARPQSTAAGGTPQKTARSLARALAEVSAAGNAGGVVPHHSPSGSGAAAMASEQEFMLSPSAAQSGEAPSMQVLAAPPAPRHRSVTSAARGSHWRAAASDLVAHPLDLPSKLPAAAKFADVEGIETAPAPLSVADVSAAALARSSSVGDDAASATAAAAAAASAAAAAAAATVASAAAAGTEATSEASGANAASVLITPDQWASLDLFSGGWAWSGDSGSARQATPGSSDEDGQLPADASACAAAAQAAQADLDREEHRLFTAAMALGTSAQRSDLADLATACYDSLGAKSVAPPVLPGTGGGSSALAASASAPATPVQATPPLAPAASAAAGESLAIPDWGYTLQVLARSKDMRRLQPVAWRSALAARAERAVAAVLLLHAHALPEAIEHFRAVRRWARSAGQQPITRSQPRQHPPNPPSALLEAFSAARRIREWILEAERRTTDKRAAAKLAGGVLHRALCLLELRPAEAWRLPPHVASGRIPADLQRQVLTFVTCHGLAIDPIVSAVEVRATSSAWRSSLAALRPRALAALSSLLPASQSGGGIAAGSDSADGVAATASEMATGTGVIGVSRHTTDWALASYSALALALGAADDPSHAPVHARHSPDNSVSPSAAAGAAAAGASAAPAVADGRTLLTRVVGECRAVARRVAASAADGAARAQLPPLLTLLLQCVRGVHGPERVAVASSLTGDLVAAAQALHAARPRALDEAGDAEQADAGQPTDEGDATEADDAEDGTPCVWPVTVASNLEASAFQASDGVRAPVPRAVLDVTTACSARGASGTATAHRALDLSTRRGWICGALSRPDSSAVEPRIVIALPDWVAGAFECLEVWATNDPACPKELRVSCWSHKHDLVAGAEPHSATWGIVGNDVAPSRALAMAAANAGISGPEQDVLPTEALGGARFSRRVVLRPPRRGRSLRNELGEEDEEDEDGAGNLPEDDVLDSAPEGAGRGRWVSVLDAFSLVKSGWRPGLPVGFVSLNVRANRAGGTVTRLAGVRVWASPFGVSKPFAAWAAGRAPDPPAAWLPAALPQPGLGEGALSATVLDATLQLALAGCAAAPPDSDEPAAHARSPQAGASAAAGRALAKAITSCGSMAGAHPFLAAALGLAQTCGAAAVGGLLAVPGQGAAAAPGPVFSPVDLFGGSRVPPLVSWLLARVCGAAGSNAAAPFVERSALALACPHVAARPSPQDHARGEDSFRSLRVAVALLGATLPMASSQLASRGSGVGLAAAVVGALLHPTRVLMAESMLLPQAAATLRAGSLAVEALSSAVARAQGGAATDSPKAAGAAEGDPGKGSLVLSAVQEAVAVCRASAAVSPDAGEDPPQPAGASSDPATWLSLLLAHAALAKESDSDGDAPGGAAADGSAAPKGAAGATATPPDSKSPAPSSPVPAAGQQQAAGTAGSASSSHTARAGAVTAAAVQSALELQLWAPSSRSAALSDPASLDWLATELRSMLLRIMSQPGAGPSVWAHAVSSWSGATSLPLRGRDWLLQRTWAALGLGPCPGPADRVGGLVPALSAVRAALSLGMSRSAAAWPVAVGDAVTVSGPFEPSVVAAATQAAPASPGTSTSSSSSSSPACLLCSVDRALGEARLAVVLASGQPSVDTVAVPVAALRRADTVEPAVVDAAVGRLNPVLVAHAVAAEQKLSGVVATVLDTLGAASASTDDCSEAQRAALGALAAASRAIHSFASMATADGWSLLRSRVEAEAGGRADASWILALTDAFRRGEPSGSRAKRRAGALAELARVLSTRATSGPSRQAALVLGACEHVPAVAAVWGDALCDPGAGVAFSLPGPSPRAASGVGPPPGLPTLPAPGSLQRGGLEVASSPDRPSDADTSLTLALGPVGDALSDLEARKATIGAAVRSESGLPGSGPSAQASAARADFRVAASLRRAAIIPTVRPAVDVGALAAGFGACLDLTATGMSSASWQSDFATILPLASAIARRAEEAQRRPTVDVPTAVAHSALPTTVPEGGSAAAEAGGEGATRDASMERVNFFEAVASDPGAAALVLQPRAEKEAARAEGLGGCDVRLSLPVVASRALWSWAGLRAHTVAPGSEGMPALARGDPVVTSEADRALIRCSIVDNSLLLLGAEFGGDLREPGTAAAAAIRLPSSPNGSDGTTTGASCSASDDEAAVEDGDPDSGAESDAEDGGLERAHSRDFAAAGQAKADRPAGPLSGAVVLLHPAEPPPADEAAMRHALRVAAQASVADARTVVRCDEAAPVTSALGAGPRTVAELAEAAASAPFSEVLRICMGVAGLGAASECIVSVAPAVGALALERAWTNLTEWMEGLEPGSPLDALLPVGEAWGRARVVARAPAPFRRCMRVAFEGLGLEFWRWVAWEGCDSATIGAGICPPVHSATPKSFTTSVLSSAVAVEGSCDIRWLPDEMAPPGWVTGPVVCGRDRVDFAVQWRARALSRGLGTVDGGSSRHDHVRVTLPHWLGVPDVEETAGTALRQVPAGAYDNEYHDLCGVAAVARDPDSGHDPEPDVLEDLAPLAWPDPRRGLLGRGDLAGDGAAPGATGKGAGAKGDDDPSWPRPAQAVAAAAAAAAERAARGSAPAVAAGPPGLQWAVQDIPVMASAADAESRLLQWRVCLKPGDRVDCFDSHNKWYEGVVIDSNEEVVTVRFIGWSPRSLPGRYDENIHRLPRGDSDPRLLPPTCKIRDWRRVQLADDVEIREGRVVENTTVSAIDQALRRVRVAHADDWHQLGNPYDLAAHSTHQRPAQWANIDRESFLAPPPVPPLPVQPAAPALTALLAAASARHAREASARSLARAGASMAAAIRGDEPCETARITFSAWLRLPTEAEAAPALPWASDAAVAHAAACYPWHGTLCEQGPSEAFGPAGSNRALSLLPAGTPVEAEFSDRNWYHGLVETAAKVSDVQDSSDDDNDDDDDDDVGAEGMGGGGGADCGRLDEEDDEEEDEEDDGDQYDGDGYEDDDEQDSASDSSSQGGGLAAADRDEAVGAVDVAFEDGDRRSGLEPGQVRLRHGANATLAVTLTAEGCVAASLTRPNMPPPPDRRSKRPAPADGHAVSTAPLPRGRWVHVAAVAGEGRIELFVDGSLRDSVQCDTPVRSSSVVVMRPDAALVHAMDERKVDGASIAAGGGARCLLLHDVQLFAVALPPADVRAALQGRALAPRSGWEDSVSVVDVDDAATVGAASGLTEPDAPSGSQLMSRLPPWFTTLPRRAASGAERSLARQRERIWLWGAAEATAASSLSRELEDDQVLESMEPAAAGGGPLAAVPSAHMLMRSKGGPTPSREAGADAAAVAGLLSSPWLSSRPVQQYSSVPEMLRARFGDGASPRHDASSQAANCESASPARAGTSRGAGSRDESLAPSQGPASRSAGGTGLVSQLPSADWLTARSNLDSGATEHWNALAMLQSRAGLAAVLGSARSSDGSEGDSKTRSEARPGASADGAEWIRPMLQFMADAPDLGSTADEAMRAAMLQSSWRPLAPPPRHPRQTQRGTGLQARGLIVWVDVYDQRLPAVVDREIERRPEIRARLLPGPRCGDLAGTTVHVAVTSAYVRVPLGAVGAAAGAILALGAPLGVGSARADGASDGEVDVSLKHILNDSLLLPQALLRGRAGSEEACPTASLPAPLPSLAAQASAMADACGSPVALRVDPRAGALFLHDDPSGLGRGPTWPALLADDASRISAEPSAGGLVHHHHHHHHDAAVTSTRAGADALATLEAARIVRALVVSK
ncbi:hypothetical protein FNF29_00202 [Cafeteria roenbergensis]|uniref:Uncharacterized protein n=1 Tax=Cafeteria roenbergensis TaxID=33653 RepID=A0A5A8CX87_CAFRO|nr:hypothetical protein FNF29_00202 [Cafeteria roenbergensis]|eukprot:KAA0157626.1 hypothetical protein FNF29_00202 [Cafeteria roenbergensis]